MPAHETLVAQLLASLAEMTGSDSAELDGDTQFLDMGADSLSLLQISQSVQDRFGIKVPFRLLIDELTTCEALAGYLEARMPKAVAVAAPAPPAAVLPEPVALPAPPPVLPDLPAAAPVADGGLEAIVARQLDLMAQQLDLLRRSRTAAPQPAAVVAPAAPIEPAAPAPAPRAAAGREEEEFVPHKPIRRALDQDLDARQREHLAALIARVSTKTQGSKSLVERDRVHHADSRTVSGFRRLWKEISYPLVATEGYGGRIRDIDGNEYVDLTMGFGSLLFGHTPPFLVDTLMREVPRGVRLGPQSYLAGDVARLISELTGAERVTFCNSGTEAVMTALRLARARTGRHKVAIFAGSYHGTADEVLARAEAGEDGGRALPLAPGIPPSALADMVVFRYNHMPSLEALRRQAHELAAVLIEPPRSRTPDVHPVEFLRELRRITEEHGAALIFDEVVTGFRTHPGGAQAIFGIHPDLSAYGKTVAAGMPIGIVAGKAEYMDAVDGGMWHFGDDSFPEAEMTFHAGTFCKHPYTMPVCKAVLEHLKAEGPALQERLTRRTEELVRELNDFFTAGDYPFKVVNFGSLFRFVYPSSLRLGELFYYHWLDHGVFVWEGRNCFLSTAHTEEDIAQIVAATKASVAAMREGGILPPPEGGKDTSPLTEAQEQLWILTQLGAESSRAYNESMTLHLRGDLDAGALRRALEIVVARHEALRATFAPDGSHQRFTPPGPVDLPRIELPAGGGDRQARIAAWIAEEAAAVFSDLVNGPLYRARLLAVEEGWHLLVLTLHHLVTDGFSNGVVLSELAQLYGALAQGATVERAAAALPPAVLYSGFVARQREERQGPEMARAEAYWTQLFAAPVPPVLDLPTNRPRPPLQGHFGDRAYHCADSELTARVRAFAREQGCTLFVALLAAYQVLLHRLTGQADLVAGTPAAGQLAAGGGALVGYCVNLLPLRSRTSPGETVASFLKGVRGQVLDAFEHQIYPFQRLIKQIDLPRDPSRLPLVAVTFTTEKAGRLPFAGLETEVVSNNNGGSKFELFLTVLETEDDELVFDAEYNSYLFDAATLRRWLGHLEQVLAAMAAEPRGRLLDLPLLNPAERHQALVEWNDTAAPYDREMLIHQLFEAQAERAPDAPAVSFETSRLTYGELNAEANRLAHQLASLGVERGRPVALLLRRSLAMVPALLGVLKAGGAYIPIDPGYPAERIQQLLASLAAPVVITHESELPTLAALRPRLPDLAHVISLDTVPDPETGLAAWPASNLPPRASAGDVAYVIFTSGSTGTPKGVVETHRPVINLIRWVNRTFAMGPADRVLFLTSLGFDLSVYDVFGLLAAGGSIRVAAEGDLRDPERLIAWLAADGITFWDSAPTALQQLVPFLAGALPAGSETRLRLIFQSGDWVPLTLPGQLRQHFPDAQLVALGGATEATVWSNHHRVREIQPDWSSIPYGRPIANARYYVLGADLAPVPLGVAGDLFIGGECLSSGYAGEPGLTASRYLPDPYAPGPDGVMYRTGDRARFRGDGEIEFLGRLDDQVKVRGFRIELGEIEAVLAQHPAVREAAVLARGDAGGDRRLVAYVVAREAAPARTPAIEELRAHLRERLPEYMVPAAFVLLAALPANANGKLDRKALPDPDFERPELAAAFEPPATPAEETLAAIWCQALGVARVGRHDGFFELGGDSILAVRIVAQARRAGLPLTPAHLFLSPTIAALGALPELAAATGGAEEGGEVPLTPIQRWFFGRALPRPQHYNQAMLLTVPADLGADVVERAFGVLLRRHEALRMRYSRGPEGWRQRLVSDAAIPCERVDLSGVPAAGREAAITATCARLQAGLDLERGPLVRVALLTLGEGELGRLAIVAHHLAVDITSWRILLEDLAAVCGQLRRGEEVTLKERTTPVRQWAEGLAGYARSAEVERQAALWTAAARSRVQPLPRDLPLAADGENTVGSAREVAVELDEPATRALLREAPRAFRTLTSEVLLAALARALGDWTGESAVLVDLEGNGREAELSGVSLARTAGWFTTLYPVLLDSSPAAGAAAVGRIKEQLRAIPQEGLGYGLLRYGGRGGVAAALAALPPAEVSFLYVGGSVSELAGAAGEGSGFALATEPMGQESAPENPRSHLLEVFAEIRDERLSTVFTYSESIHRRETVERLAADYLAALRSLLADLPGAAPVEPAPADFPHADLTQDELDALLVHFGSEGD